MIDKDLKKKLDSKKFRRKLLSKHKRKLRRSGIFSRRIAPYTEKIGKEIEAPINFSFQKNMDEVLGFISRLERMLNEKKSVFVNLQNVASIDIEAIVLLLGIMAEFHSSSVDFNGNFPINPYVKNKLDSSGFLQKLYGNDSTYTFGSNRGIFTHGKNVLDQVLTSEIISDSLEAVFDQRRRSMGAQRILVEAMKNTLQHASNDTTKRHWWLSVRKEKKDKKVIFSFVDYGVGIFKSLQTKSQNDPGYNRFSKLFNLGVKNRTILSGIMDGSLQAVSRTRQSKHGTGLPGMKTALDNNYISKFVILSNDVYAEVHKNEYRTVKPKFSGTLIQFEIINSCKSFKIV